jgi:hypothetical protein
VDCTGSLLIAEPGTRVITYFDGTVPAGGDCSIIVDIVGVAAGNHENVTSELTSTNLEVVAPPATATLKFCYNFTPSQAVKFKLIWVTLVVIRQPF